MATVGSPCSTLLRVFVSDMGPVGEIPGCHATAPARRRNLQTQYPDGVECLG